MRLKITDICVVEKRRKLDDTKVAELADSIREVGLLNPITVSSKNQLVAGNHRLEACRLLGHHEIECTQLVGNDLLLQLAEIDENLIRNELDPISIGELAIKRDEILESLGSRALSGQGRPSKKGAPGAPLKTTTTIAKEIGISECSLLRRNSLGQTSKQQVRSVR